VRAAVFEAAGGPHQSGTRCRPLVMGPSRRPSGPIPWIGPSSG
jgi:hypothetical protein